MCIVVKISKKLSIIFSSILLLGFVLTGCSNQTSNDTEDDKVIKIGYQKNGPLFIVKSLGTLEEILKEKGITVEWKEFQDGPSLLEALNAGSIDFGRTGNTPPIFSQAAGSQLTYVAAGFSKYEGSGILVKNDSTITSISDLKGKKIAFSKGSSSHYLLVKALESVGLSLNDIEPAYLTPGNARIAFEQDQVDAWVVWDPYTSSTEVNADAKLLVNGEGLTTDRDFFVSTENFATNQEEILDIVLNEVSEAMDWANSHHEELINLLATELKMDQASVTLAVERRVYGVEDISNEILNEQQEIADLFYELEIIPTEITVNEGVKK